MVTIKHTPAIHSKFGYVLFNECYTITGDNIEEIIDFCKPRVRSKNWNFYENELIRDLQKIGKSIIDHHAGMGTEYSVILKTI